MKVKLIAMTPEPQRIAWIQREAQEGVEDK